MSQNNPKRKKGKKSGEPCIVRKSNIPGAGRGVFAKRLIRKGDVVGFYDGIVYNKIQTLLEYCKDYEKTYDKFPIETRNPNEKYLDWVK